MSLEFYNKNINTRPAEEVSTPSPSPSPAVGAPAQKPKGPSIFTSDDAVPVQGSSNEPIQMTSSSATGSKFSGLQLSDADGENSISLQENSELIKLEEDFAQYAKKCGLPEGISFSEYKTVLEHKNPNELTNDEKNFLERYNAIYNNSDHSTVKIQAKEPIQESMQLDEKTKQRISEYDAILKDPNPETTPYQKNSKIIDKYLSEHDSEYQKLTNPRQKREYRDAIIHDFMEAIHPGNKTQAQRRVIQLEIAKIFVDCEAKGENVRELMAQGPEAIKTRIAQIGEKESAKVSEFFDNLELDSEAIKNMKPEDAIYTIGKKLMMATDLDFEKKYPTEKQQREVILKYTKDKIKEFTGLDIDAKHMTPEQKEHLYKFSMVLFEEIKNDMGGDLKKLQMISDPKVQNKILAQVFSKHPGLIEGASKEGKEILNNLKARADIAVCLYKTQDIVTEGDIYNFLKNIKPEDLTQEQKDLLNFYSKIEEMSEGDKELVKKIFSEQATFDSLIGKAAIAGMTPKDYIMSQLKDKDGNLLTGEALFKSIERICQSANGDKDATTILLLNDILTNDLHLQKKDANRFINGLTSPEAVMFDAAKGGRHLAKLMNVKAECCTNKKELNDFGNAIACSVKVLDNQTVADVYADLDTNVFDDNITFGINQYKSVNDALDISYNIINNDNVADTRKSSYTRSLVVTCTDPQRQLTYSNELSQLDNKAVNEGLAAAEPYVDNSVRNQYSQNIDNSITRMEQSGKYSSEEIAQMKKDIQQARETGMTKAETAQAKKTQEEVKTATQKAQQQQKAEQKAQKEALEQKKQTVLNYAKTVIATATASKPKASTSTATSSHTQAIEDAQKSLNQTLERLAKAQSVAETDRVRRELMMRIEQFQAEVRISQEERDLRIQLSEREVVNALLAESAAEEEAQASQEAQEAVAVATDTEVTAEDGATAEVRSQAEKSGLSTEAVQELQNAYSSGGLVALYDKAATIVGSKAQEKLLNYISHASSSTLHSFADAHSNNKHVLMTLFKNSKDPYIMQLLIRNGYASEVLGSGAVSVKDFMAHASAQTVANWLVDLQKTGATYTLKQAFEHLQDDSKAMASSLIPGSDEWRQAQQTRMSTASAEQTDNLSQTDPARTASASVSSNGLFEEYEGLALGSDRVRMGIPVDKKVDKRFFRMG